MLLHRHEAGISLSVKLTPKATQNNLTRVEQDSAGNKRLRVTVTSVPEKGKANTALIKLLSKKLGLPKTSITLIAGEQSRLKTILFTGDADTLFETITRHLKTLGLSGTQ